MAKFKASVYYEGCIEIVVDADNEENAKAEALVAFDEEIPASEIEANILGVSASAYEIDEEDE